MEEDLKLRYDEKRKAINDEYAKMGFRPAQQSIDMEISPVFTHEEVEENCRTELRRKREEEATLYEEKLRNEKRKSDGEEDARKKQDDKIDVDAADEEEEEDEEEDDDEEESDEELEEDEVPQIIYNIMFTNPVTQLQLKPDAERYGNDLLELRFQIQSLYNSAHWLLKAPFTSKFQFKSWLEDGFKSIENVKVKAFEEFTKEDVDDWT